MNCTPECYNRGCHECEAPKPPVDSLVMPDPCTICDNVDCAMIINPCRDRLWYAHMKLHDIQERMDEMIDAACAVVPDLYRVDAMRAIEAAFLVMFKA